ncbi:MAG: dual specificity protein phosphatase family protein [Acidobacteriota bacterium]|nr:dual specificity protein phosphatase family protein [Acidobacteriota bacterium]
MKLPPTIYSIEGPWKGRLAIVPRPRGGEWLEDEVQAWRDGHLDVIVSLLTASETSELGLDDEAKLSAAIGLQFLQFPISDYSVPTSFERAVAFIEELDQALGIGKSVGIHCRQGIGRSATLASSLLVQRGVDPDEAWNRVGKARGCHVPDTFEQRDWVSKFASYLARTLSEHEALTHL